MYLLLELSNHAAIELKFTNAKYDYNCNAIPIYKKSRNYLRSANQEPEMEPELSKSSKMDPLRIQNCYKEQEL